MKAGGKNSVHVLMPVLLVCLLLLTCTVYAAPATAPKSTQPAQPVGGTTSTLFNPNAPPQGTITITPSSKDNVNSSTWYTGTYQYIQWTCSGTRSNLVDVTLWQNNQQVVVIGKGIASGQTAYTVPSTMAVGSYELRLTSKDDTRVVARQPVTVIVAKTQEITTGQLTVVGQTQEITTGQLTVVGQTQEITTGQLTVVGQTQEITTSQLTIVGQTQEITTGQLTIVGQTQEITTSQLTIVGQTQEITTGRLTVMGKTQ